MKKRKYKEKNSYSTRRDDKKKKKKKKEKYSQNINNIPQSIIGLIEFLRGVLN